MSEHDISIENISFTVLATRESKAVDRLASVYIKRFKNTLTDIKME